MSARDAQPKAIRLRDYRAPDYLIDRTHLRVDIGSETTQVSAQLNLRRNPAAAAPVAELALNGVDIRLISVAIDGRALAEHEYRLDSEYLVLINPPEQFELQTVGEIKPQLNKSMEGLYRSRTIFCTQCEAEGFRKITWYLDRPDVMSEFTTTVVADKAECPLLLSNGNLIEAGDLDQGRHFATWHDPHRKPAYLFALVAGDLQHLEDTFTTTSGREVSLKIYVEEKDLDKCEHALESLKNAMRWDEQVYGREYDLDIYMVVAVDDFNMGAMENKGLNIFNTACVLAHPETTTDKGFQRVESVVAHEYFHNWSGNRVTCRDWFQLSLKEGFTVYRDAMFSADMGSPTVKRVEDVSLLRSAQFAEDAGPMAHPVRPESYIEISNFYTLTIYEKGSEVVRMLANLLGPELFRKGADLYFDRHDGEAVTTDDFVAAMEEVSGRDLTQFKRWYSQAGTPQLEVTDAYDAAQQQYRLTITQSCPPTPDSQHKQPFHIPLAMGLVGEAGPMPLRLKGQNPESENREGEGADTHRVLELTEREHTFTFEGVAERPVPALLRDFSAPVRLSYDYSRDDLMRLMRAEDDGFCRWDASQQLALRVLDDVMAAYRNGQDLTQITIDARLVDAYRALLNDSALDPALVALMLTLPSEAYIAEQLDTIDVEAIHHSREGVRRALGWELEPELRRVLAAYDPMRPYQVNAQAIAERALANLALGYLMLTPDRETVALCEQHYRQANNMTDRLSALTYLVNSPAKAAQEQRELVLNDFYQRWQNEALVVDEWLRVQATCSLPGTLEQVRRLESHPAFDPLNPNKLRALIGAFSNANPIHFHDVSGEGYQILTEHVLRLDKPNPQMAARLLTPLTRWRRYSKERAQRMRAQLEHIMAQPDVSKDVYEVVSKSLA